MVLLEALTAQADSYPYLTFQNSDGTTQSVSVSSLVLTFSNGNLVATNSDGSLSITLGDLSKMYFSTSEENSSSGISEIEATGGTATVYTLSGTRLGEFGSLSEARTELRKGIYVVVVDGKSYKITIK